jgi:methylisocitrate lyase
MTDKGTLLRTLLADGQVFAPCIWDCFSARAAELEGFEATLLSGGALGRSMSGVPDIALMNAEELIWATERIADYSPLPLIVDADDGYGETALTAYRTARRLARGGAAALTLDDTTGVRGYARWGRAFRESVGAAAPEQPISHPTVSRDAWLQKVRAGLDACEGTDCLLIARTEAKLTLGLDEAIERCARALELGAEMTLIIGLKNIDECRQVAAQVPGWKMYPDVASTHGVPDVELDEAASLGFNLVTMHYLEKASMYGMLDFSRHVFADRTTVYADEHPMAGFSKAEQELALHDDSKWLEIERVWATETGPHKRASHPAAGAPDKNRPARPRP